MTKFIAIYNVLAHIDWFFLFFLFLDSKSDDLGWSGSSPDIPRPLQSSPDLPDLSGAPRTSPDLSRAGASQHLPEQPKTLDFGAQKQKKQKKTNQYLLKRCKLQ